MNGAPRRNRSFKFRFIATTDRPYYGATGVSPLAYELVLQGEMQATP
jgi:hypothetical protein